MKQWFSDLSGLDSLKQVTADVPEPGADEVLVKIHAVSLNYRDVEGQPAMLTPRFP
jgi:NADPH:quinone reductase-like Zn-dependent oxidoreductase